MARPRSFDADKVLDAAVECFWRDGMHSASTRALSQRMGIAGPSLYNAFGCKRELFSRALERYADTNTRANLARLESTLAPKQAIHGFFARLIDNLLQRPDPRGCLLINTAMEVDPEDAALCDRISNHLDEIAAFFERTVKAGQIAGDIPRGTDPHDTARMLLSTALGICVQARSRPERGDLEAAMRPALALLDNPTDQRDQDQTDQKGLI